MALTGKGYFIWQIPNCDNGVVDTIANLAQQCGFTHILIKVADGTYSYNVDSSGNDLVPPLVAALKARRITVWGWHYIYGNYPAKEANKAIERINNLGLAGYALDVEGEFKQAGKDEAAALFMTKLRNALPDFPVALCSYRYPSYHAKVPWKIFLERCDYNMPQVYWEQAHNPGAQLTRSVSEFQAMTPYRPIIPVGSAYVRGSWAPTTADILEFLQTAQNLGLTAANFWEWSNTRRNLPDVWNTIRDYDWSNPLGPDMAQQLVDAWNSHNANQVTNLYASNGVHVNSARTVQGATAIYNWYQSLFSLLPQATFTLTSSQGSNSSRHFTWRAVSSAGSVDDGNDTLGILNGKIVYHFTYFSVN